MKRLYPSSLLLALLVGCCALQSAAQSKWNYLYNVGMTSKAGYRLEDVYFLDSLRGFAITLNNRIFKTTTGGVVWAIKNDTLDKATFRCIEFLDDGLTGIAGGIDSLGKVFRTSDGGESWVNISNAVSDTALNGPKRICGLSHFGHTFFGVGWWGGQTARFYKSTDKGLTWTTSYIDTALASCLVDVVFTSPTTGFASGGKNNPTLSGSIFSSNRSVVLKTTDGGGTWTTVFQDTVIGGRIWKLQFLNSQTAFGSIEPFFSDTVAMIKSTDGGASWTVCGTGYHQSTSGFGTQGVGFVTPLKGWLGGYYYNLFQTEDGGNTWDVVPFGYNFNRFFVLDSDHVFAGGGEVYRYGPKAIPFAVPATPAPAAPHHRLYPIAPNPSHGRVKIEFDLVSASNVVLEVAYISGKRGWPVVNKYLPAGHHIFYWNGEDAPAGAYLVWLGTDTIPLVAKFILQH